MKKLLMLLAAVMMSVVLMTPTAFAAPLVNSATEPPPETEVDEPNDSVEIGDPNVPLSNLPDNPAEPPDQVEIGDPDVPLGSMPSPQTGVTGLSGAETVSLMAAALAVSGALVLAKARKQTGSVR